MTIVDQILKFVVVKVAQSQVLRALLLKIIIEFRLKIQEIHF